MREIKFKAYNKTNDSFVYADLNTAHNTLFYSWLSEPMQYTGLKDKNGKEIYEGDLITGACHAKDELDIGIIEYQDAMFVVEYKGEEISESLFNNIYDCESDIEIIGNIHENPELLEN